MCSFLSTTHNVLHDPIMAELAERVTTDTDEAYATYYGLFDGKDKQEISANLRGFPPDSTTLIEACSISNQHSTNKRMKMQAKLTGPVILHGRDKLRDSCDREQQAPTTGTTFTDMMHTSLLMLRSQATRIINSPLFYEKNRIDAREFVFYWRYYLGLPRLIRPGRPVIALPEVPAEDLVAPPRNNVGNVVEVCPLRHGCTCTLSPNGAHEISCPSTYKARYRTHGSFTRVCAARVLMVNGEARTEPKTVEVLLNEFTEAEVRGLMPKVVSTVGKKRCKALATIFTKMGELDAGAPEMAPLMEAIKVHLMAMPDDTKGVRLDLEFTLEDGRSFMCDFTGVHPASKKALEQLRAFMKANKLAKEAAGGAAINNALARAASPAVVNAAKAKVLRYELLMDLLIKQVKEGKRASKPRLVSGVITHLGELGPDMIDTVEALTNAANKQFKAGPLTMGMSRSKYTAIFRTQFKDELLAANARGFVRALAAAGNPMSGWVLSPDEVGEDLPDWDVKDY